MMKAYDSYKDSGVEWIGDIPSHWHSTPLKRSVKIGNGRDYKHFEVENGGYPVYGTGGEFSRCSEYLHTGPSVLLGRKGTIDNPLFVNEPFWTADTIYFTIIDESKIVPSLLFWLVHQIPFDLFSYGSTIPSMTKSDYEEMKFPLPPLSEQQQIVSFLDTKTPLIDSLIEKTQRKIELLREKRTSIINEAVTKGLDPNMEMKDSGVEWIGEIPTDWENGKLGYYSNVFRGSGYQYLNQVNDDYKGEKERVVRISDITDFNPIWCEYKEQFENYRIEPDNILVGGTGHYFGKSIYVTKEMEGLIHSYNIIRVVIKKQYPKYVQYWLSSSNIREQMDISVLGSGQPFIDIQGLKDLQVIIPPLSEQYEIVSYLDEQTQKIDKSILKEEERTNLLKEYRQSLISSVVKGKIKVTENA